VDEMPPEAAGAVLPMEPELGPKRLPSVVPKRPVEAVVLAPKRPPVVPGVPANRPPPLKPNKVADEPVDAGASLGPAVNNGSGAAGSAEAGPAELPTCSGATEVAGLGTVGLGCSAARSELATAAPPEWLVPPCGPVGVGSAPSAIASTSPGAAALACSSFAWSNASLKLAANSGFPNFRASRSTRGSSSEQSKADHTQHFSLPALGCRSQ